MAEFPDLGLPEEFCFHPDTSELEEPHEEGVFFDESGSMIGQVAVFQNWSSDYIIKTKEQYDVEFLQIAAALGSSCCRVVVEYHLDNTKRACQTCETPEAAFYWCQTCNKALCDSCSNRDCDALKLTLPHKTIELDVLDKEFPQSKFYTGSAFRVSETCLLTAGHVVKPSHNLTSTHDSAYTRRYNIHKICIVAYHSASISAGLRLEEDKSRNCYEVERVPDCMNFGERFPASKWETPIKWKQPFDFCMLKFKNQGPTVTQMPIAVPCISPSGFKNLKVAPSEEFPALRYCVLGFPTQITYEKFLDDYYPLYRKKRLEQRKAGATLGEKELNEFIHKYQDVLFTCRGFEKLIVSFAAHGADSLLASEPQSEASTASAASTTTDPILRGHRCPTLRGVSGGPLAFLVDFLQYHVPIFGGLHLGGSTEMRGNIFVSTCDPSLAVQYAKVVLETPDSQTIAAVGQAKKAFGPFLAYHQTTFEKFGVTIHPLVLNAIVGE